MTICFSGTRFYDPIRPSNVIKITDMVVQILDKYPQSLVFGTAKGIDLDIFMYFIRNTSEGIGRGGLHDQGVRRPHIINVCPDTINDLNEKNRHNVEQYSDEVVELGNPIIRSNWYSSYQIRNEWMVDNSDVLYAFPLKNPSKGPKKGGTWNTIKYAQRIECPVTITELE